MIEYENLRKLNEPFYREFNDKFQSVLSSGWFILGDQVREFEERFAAYCNSNFCIGTANGLDALTLGLKALNFEPGKEVIVPSNTYIATILAILNAGLKPVLVEPDLRTYNIDASLIEQSINRNTVAIMVVHLYGKCCQMDKIVEIAQRKNIKLIEDCAQAHGAMFKGKRAGTFGDLSAFSFYPTKNLGGLGDGGSINTNSEPLARLIRMLRNYGSEKKYYNEIVGTNSRLDELQAAFLLVKLKYLEEINNHKRRLAAIYRDELNDDFIKPVVHADYTDVFHIFNIRHPKRDQLREFLNRNEVGSEIHYPVSPHRQKAMKGILDGQDFPISDEIHATTLSLPISFFHSEDDIQAVCKVLNSF